MVDRKIIEELASEELVDANAKHDPKFNSPHEAYAVIKEELEEMQDEVEMCGKSLEYIWDNIKDDTEEGCKKWLEYMKEYAISAAQEAIQVVAMCDKAMKLY